MLQRGEQLGGVALEEVIVDVTIHIEVVLQPLDLLADLVDDQ